MFVPKDSVEVHFDGKLRGTVQEKRKIWDDSGNVLDANFDLVEEVSGFQIVYFSRHQHVRKDYNPALELILSRLRELGAVITDILVDTQETRKHNLPISQRRLPVREVPYPIKLIDHPDSTYLRLGILDQIGKVGLVPGRKGSHTPLKQLSIHIEVPGGPPFDTLVEYIASGTGGNRSRYEDIDEPTSQAFARAKGVSGFYRSSAEERNLMELHSLAVVAAEYEGRGFLVEDVHTRESYDLRLWRDDVEYRVEVKATAGEGDAILLTSNEVEHATTFPRIVLAILSSVEVATDASGAVVVRGGTLRLLEPWQLDRRDLRATQYSYTVPK